MATSYALDLDQGSTFKFTVIYDDPDGNPINLTGYTPRMQVRRAPNERGGPLFEANSTNGFAVVDGPIGRIDVTIPDDVTVKFNTRKLVYDLILISPGGEKQPA